VVPISEARNDHTKVKKFKDASRCYRTTDTNVYVDKTYVGRSGDGYDICKVRTRADRCPVIGDKFSSRHGQKGTIGNIMPEHKMPVTESGITPDIIVNPHAIPSRMTIAQLFEMLLGKAAVNLGCFGDGTAFMDLAIEDLKKTLHDAGLESFGNEIMYNAETGEQIETLVFIGPCYYQRLKHMVIDKINSQNLSLDTVFQDFDKNFILLRLPNGFGDDMVVRDEQALAINNEARAIRIFIEA
jgi:DNA-directed RNA polymerase II subunit RPB2